jgi:mannose-6-phosphate isomerase-like protein (cupin superfamily)
MIEPTPVSAPSDVTFRNLGTVDFRVVVPTEETEGVFALAEFRGGEGAWTIPHVHVDSVEGFYILDGRFTFTLGTQERPAERGDFVLIPKGTRHLMRAEVGGGRFLTLWTPGGLERMFLALSELPAAALLDVAARRAIAERFDSIPV